MRGKVYVNGLKLIPNGITPAYAGKSNVGMLNIRSEGDHPRLCGEKIRTKAQANRSRGSPPPMRGKGNLS